MPSVQNPLQARILVVDDEPSVLTTLSAVLAHEGYEVESAADGQAAIDNLRTRNFDLVLTDLRMPRVEGLELVETINRVSPHTVCVVLTGYASMESAIQAVHLGAYEYLLKPIEIEELKLAVRRSLERKKLSEIDTLFELGRQLILASDLRTVESQLAQAARNVLRLENLSVVQVSNGTPEFPCNGMVELLLRDRGVQAELRQGHIVISTSRQAAQPEDSIASASMALVPGAVNGELRCILAADNGRQAFDFSGTALRFLETMANQAALTIANLAHIAELREKNAELERLNARLTQLDEFKSEFIAIASHELKAPISVIMGYNAMLAEQAAPRLQDDERGMLDRSVEACRRLISMVRSVLDFAQIESGKLPVVFSSGDLTQLVNDAVANFAFDARARGVRLIKEMPTHPMVAPVDADRMQQVLTNLISNALKFTPRGGEVRIAAVKNDSGIRISVSDTGPGIPRAEQSKLFQRFSRTGSSAAVEGSGMGLVIARKLVEAHGGNLQFSSEPGKGSTFTVMLPMRQQVKARTAVA